MSGINVAAILAELLPVAESLFGLIQKIKTEAPDAWASVSAEWVSAATAWEQAKKDAAEKQTATIANIVMPEVSATVGAEIPPANIVMPEVSATVGAEIPARTGLTSAQQAAAGLPLAHYTG